MTETVIMALISLGKEIVGTVTAYTKSHYVGVKFKKRKDAYGNDVFPAPFPAASCEVEHVASLEGETGIRFSFDRFNASFVSLVFPYDPPVNLKRVSTISVEVEFKCDALKRIDVEIINSHFADTKHDRFIPISLNRVLGDSVARGTFCIEKASHDVKKILECVTEISLVIRPTASEDGCFMENTRTKDMNGSFAVRKINIEK